MSSLACGIVGLPNVGKSTLFNALLKRKAAAAENFPFCTIDPNVGIVELKDPRLDQLAVLSKSKKIVNAAVSFVDIAGLVKGASKGEGLGNQFLSHIRQTDAIVQVVRCFSDEEIVHVAGEINPLEDVTTINLELILADLQMIENIIHKMEKQIKGRKEVPIEFEVLKKAKVHLDDEQLLRTLDLIKEEREVLSSYNFLTNKKTLYVANIKEEDIDKKDNVYVQKLEEYAKKENSLVIPLCAKIEEEIAQLEGAEALEFLQSLGLQESGLDRLTKAAFRLLGLITFITTGEIETKAWTINKGMTAAEAAGKIHSDIQKGFIRAEVVSYDDMIKYSGRVGARDVGKAPSEGRDYIVKDGDVILFYHN